MPKTIQEWLDEIGDQTEFRLRQPAIDLESFKNFCFALDRNTSLKALNLDEVQLDLDKVYYLRDFLLKNPGLEKLSLSKCGLDAIKVRALADSLIYNEQLTELNLYGNAIKSRGAAHIAQMLIENYSLTTLWLSANQISKPGFEALSQVLENCNFSLQKLYLGDNLAGPGSTLILDQIERYIKRNNENPTPANARYSSMGTK